MTTTRRASAATASAVTAETTRSTRASTRKAQLAVEGSGNADTKTPKPGAVSAGKPQTRKRTREADKPSTGIAHAPEGDSQRSRGRPRKSVPAAPTPSNAAVVENAEQEPHADEATAQDAVQEPPSKRSRHSGRRSKAGAAPMAVIDASVALVDAGNRARSPHQGESPDRPPAVHTVVDAEKEGGTKHAASPRQVKSPTLPPAAPAVALVNTAADIAHQLQPSGPSVLPPSPSQPPPLQQAQPPRSPLGQRQPQAASPVRKPLGTSNTAGVVGCIPPAATAPAPMPSSPKPQLADAPKRSNGLTEQDVIQVRRLMLPGALAGTLVSCAAASAVTSSAATEGGGEGVAVEPAGRAGQFKELCGMVSECCSSGRGSAIYISGLPGTGKTYTVSRLLAALPGLAAGAGGKPDTDGNKAGVGGAVSFCCATVNCMAIDDPAKLYGKLQNELVRAAAAQSGKSSGPQVDLADAPTPTDAAAAHDSLLKTLLGLSLVRSGPAAAGGAASKAKGKGTKRGRGTAAEAGPQRRVFVVVLDEVDRLLRRRDGGEELARLFHLPAAAGLSLVLLAVANSLDLTEKMMPLLRARGLAPRHMVFTAYSRPQVLAILKAQLAANPLGPRCFDEAALDMVAKSVSSTSGDLRQALKACRTALDVLVEANRSNPATAKASVGIREMHTALQRISSQGNGQSAMVAKIKGLPPQQQLVLLALATAVGARAAAAGADSAPGSGAVFTGSRPKFADTVAFRELANQPGATAAAANNPGACFDGPSAGPTPSKAARPGASAASTPSVSRVRGITGPGGGGVGATPTSRAPPSRTPGSILAGDAGLALGLADVYAQYVALCRQLDIPAMSESAFRTDALPGLDCDGLLRMTEGRTPAATRLSLRAMVRDVQTALADNVMFKRLMGAKAQGGAAPGAVGGALRA